MNSSDKFLHNIIITLAIAVVCIVAIVSYAVVTANKNNLSVHRSAYEQCISAIDTTSRYTAPTQCSGLSNDRPHDIQNNR